MSFEEKLHFVFSIKSCELWETYLDQGSEKLFYSIGEFCEKFKKFVTDKKRIPKNVNYELSKKENEDKFLEHKLTTTYEFIKKFYDNYDQMLSNFDNINEQIKELLFWIMNNDLKST